MNGDEEGWTTCNRKRHNSRQDKERKYSEGQEENRKKQEEAKKRKGKLKKFGVAYINDKVREQKKKKSRRERVS